MISSYVHQSQVTLRRWVMDPRVHRLARGGAHGLAGFCLSAASLGQGMLPLVMGLVWACRGWRAVLVAAGGVLGYGVFWGDGCLQGILWTGLALLGVLLLGDKRIAKEQPLLVPAVGMLMVSAVGLGFQLLAGDTTSVPLHLIRVALGGAAPWLFTRWIHKREAVTQWLCWGLFALGLAQMAPVYWLGLGYVAVGVAAVKGAMPCAAAVGLALDAAGITPVPMTAVAACSFFLRLLPRCPRWFSSLGPGLMGLFLMYLCGRWDLLILPGLFLGGIVAGFFTRSSPGHLRRGETGVAQVRLEMAAGVLGETGRLLEQVPERFVDTDGMVQRAVWEACSGCSARDRCRESRKLSQLKGDLLHKPLLTMEELPVRCRKGSRILMQLRKSQEQLRSIQADRQSQQEYREAVIQQYTFLESYLRSLSDDLSRHSAHRPPLWEPEVAVYGSHKWEHNGDRCVEFRGTGNRYYILLCDGMGTGNGAVRAGQQAAGFLRRMLSCGFPASHALRSFNSLCALRDRAGIVTVDLAEVDLESGRAELYKWGAAASYLLKEGGVEKLGSVSVPPGFSVTEIPENRCGITLRKEQTLLLVSDGVEEETVLKACQNRVVPAVLAEKLLKNTSSQDDATVVTVRLIPAKV